MIRIEFTEATEVREVGEQVAVDDNSAKVFVEDLGVAKYLDVDAGTEGVTETVGVAEPDAAPVVVDEVAPPTDDADPVVIPADGAYVKPETSPVYEPGE